MDLGLHRRLAAGIRMALLEIECLYTTLFQVQSVPADTIQFFDTTALFVASLTLT
jgi:hypothetical protein